jgi:hypothetical protein
MWRPRSQQVSEVRRALFGYLHLEVPHPPWTDTYEVHQSRTQE